MSKRNRERRRTREETAEEVGEFLDAARCSACGQENDALGSAPVAGMMTLCSSCRRAVGWWESQREAQRRAAADAAAKVEVKVVDPGVVVRALALAGLALAFGVARLKGLRLMRLQWARR